MNGEMRPREKRSLYIGILAGGFLGLTSNIMVTYFSKLFDVNNIYFYGAMIMFGVIVWIVSIIVIVRRIEKL